ncbi:MAG: molybdopterin-dependent oxidoreductase [Kofleriaceae bacterium]
MNRRDFLAIVGGTLALAACGPNLRALRIKHADESGELHANLYITVLPTGHIRLIVNKAEIGQGVSTGYSTLVAEELGVPIDHVEVQFASSNRAMRGSANMQLTGGSTSTAEAFVPLRRAAASAREMLKAAAAAQWAVPVKDVGVADGFVTHGDQRLGYGELTKAAAKLPVPEHVTLKAVKDFKLIGKIDRRVDAQAKVDGTAKFGIDTVVPNMVNAYAIHGPVFGAAPVKVSVKKKHPATIDVLSFEWGVAVVAPKYWQARAQALDLEIEWDHGFVHGLDTEKMFAAMRVADDDDTEVFGSHGDAKPAIAHAEIKVGGVYEAPYLAHAPMEPQNAVASVENGKCTIWAPSQSPTIYQNFVSQALGIGMDDVTVHVTLCGGGFGRRAIGDVAAQAALISARVKRPVKLTWTRESDMTQGWYRPVYAVRVGGGVHDGKVTGAKAHVISQSILLSGKPTFGAALADLPRPIANAIVDAGLSLFSTNSVGEVFGTEGMRNTPYQFGAWTLTSEPVQTRMPVSFWRSVGNSVTGFVMEGLVDEMCVAAKADPFVFRRGILPATSKQRRVIDRLEQLAEWGRSPERGVGRGMARHFAFETEVAQVADVELVGNRIRVKRVYCVVDCGIAVNPDIVKAQMESSIIFGISAALDQEITLKDGVVQQRNFDDFPLLRMYETPEIFVEIMPSEEAPTGVGEPGLPPIAPAIANALFRLTGVRLRKMPLQRAWKERGAA